MLTRIVMAIRLLQLHASVPRGTVIRPRGPEPLFVRNT